MRLYIQFGEAEATNLLGSNYKYNWLQYKGNIWQSYTLIHSWHQSEVFAEWQAT